MLIFYTNLGQGGPYWFLGPLLMLLPLILGGGFLSLPLQLLSLFFGGGGVFSTTYLYDSVTGWQLSGSRTVGSSAAGWLSFFATMFFTIAFFAIGILAREMHRHGVLPTLRRLLLPGWHGGAPPRRQQAPRGQGGAAVTQQQRFERVARLMQSLPTEVFHSREELEAMSVAELKGLLRKTGQQCREQPLEKWELIDCLQFGGNSTATSCSICCDDYAAGDVLRVLRCQHRFHLECIDRWLLSSADYSRPPACPMCNAELAGPGAQ